MNKKNGLIIGLVIIVIALLGYIAFKPNHKNEGTLGESSSVEQAPALASQSKNPTDPKTGLVYPSGFSIAPSNSDLLVRFVRGSDFIEIAEKYPNDPTCEKFYQGENFGFCVKGYHGEASSDEVANLFINLNK